MKHQKRDRELTEAERATRTATLNLDEIDHMAALSPGGGAIARALIRRIRELEATMRTFGDSLKNFVGEDDQEGRELAAMSRDLIAMADKGTAP